jgi:hypothetical protein
MALWAAQVWLSLTPLLNIARRIFCRMRSRRDHRVQKQSEQSVCFS